jgi:hypothetical protein
MAAFNPNLDQNQRNDFDFDDNDLI